jgi:hypothetical protein
MTALFGMKVGQRSVLEDLATLRALYTLLRADIRHSVLIEQQITHLGLSTFSREPSSHCLIVFVHI